MSGIVYCDKTPDLPLGHLAIIDGKSTMTSSDFLHCVGEQLKFPDAQNCNWDAYLDWMRDLSWLDTKSISIVILNFDSFLCKEPDNLKYFSSDLEEVVFPFWQNDAESVFESQDAVKDITVYCVRSELTTNEQVTTKEAMSIIRQNALNGQKTPHSTSQPVLRLYDGKVCFAAFVFFYNKEQLQSAMVNRPTMWVIGDLKTGEIVQRYLCSDNEFSDSEYQKLYNVSAKDVLTASKLYWDSAYALMDLIRHEYASCGTLNKKLYKEYLERISCTTPEEYRVFYKDLNNIEMEDDFMDTEKKLPTDEVAEQAAETPSETVAPQGELLAKLDAVQQALATLQQTFDDKIAEDTHKNGLFDNMHRELIRYQNGALDKIVDTIALDIIQLVDTTKGHVRVYEKKEPTEENYKKLLRIVKGIAEDLEDILYRQNIESYRVPGHEVDTRRQKIIQTMPTDDKSKDNLVAVRAADGYEKGDKVLRPERIKIYKYEASSETPSEN